MSSKNPIFPAVMYVKHRLCSRHTLGHGIHSPHLFYIARAILPDSNAYYCFAPIERVRQQMLASTSSVDVVDYGTGHSGKRSVRSIASSSLKPRMEAQLLLRLAVMQKAREIVELGTSLGISTAYLASASSESRVTTFEGAPEIAEMAERNWKALKLRNIDCKVGDIDETLLSYKPASVLDIAYLDANHTYEATMRYFNYLHQFAGPDSIFILDDIHYSRDMQNAWLEICRHPAVSATMDLYSMGLVFFDKNYERKTYCIRL